jgi:O-antigen/teichoic acid export membrane protein
VLARLLGPADFGIFAMVMPLVLFGLLFEDLGLSAATIQRPELAEDQVNQLFWVNVFAGLLLTLITVASAPLVAAFYHEKRLVPVTMVLGTAFFIAGLAAQQRALLQREMRLTFLSVTRVIASLAGAACGITAAALGLGYWSLVVVQLVDRCVATASVWLIPQFRPRFTLRMKGVRDFLSFGVKYTGFNVLTFVSSNVDNVLIGRYWGSTELGYYSRAYSLLLLPMRNINSPFANVVVPGLSKLHQDKDRYAGYYLKALSMLAGLALPAVVVLIVLSDDIVRVFLGAQWLPSVRIFVVLGIVAILNTTYSTTAWINISLGRAGRQLKWGAFNVVASVIGIVCGLSHGGFGVAIGYATASFLVFLPGLWYGMRWTPIHLKAVLMANVRPMIVAAGVGLGAYAVASLRVSSKPYLRLCAELAAAIALWAILSPLVSRKDSPLWQLISLVRNSKLARNERQTVHKRDS